MDKRWASVISLFPNWTLALLGTDQHAMPS